MGTLDIEMIGMLVINFWEISEKYAEFDFKHLKVPRLLVQYPKNTEFTENFLETFRFYSIKSRLDGKRADPKKYQNFISAGNFPENPKIPKS